MKGIIVSVLLVALGFTNTMNGNATGADAKPQAAQKDTAAAVLRYVSPMKGALKTVKLSPTPKNYLNLSTIYYSNGLFEESVSAAKLALKLKPAYAEAYNIIGAACNNMKMWDEAIAALNKALSIDPGFQLAGNNLTVAKNGKASSGTAAPYVSPIKGAVKTAELNPTPANYLNLSLAYYTHGLFEESVSAAKLALKLRPNYAVAYNNMGAACNNMKMWDEAIIALNKALSIDPGFQLARNNLNAAIIAKSWAGW